VQGYKSFKDLQTQWYKKLEDQDFLDIENTKHPNRPLKEWHSFKMTAERFQIIRAKNSEYQGQIEDFLNNPAFEEACKSMIKHGNCKFKIEEVHLIWELHVQGETTRSIGKKLGRVKSRIDGIIDGLREWMKLV
jgi:hypothetical protein